MLEPLSFLVKLFTLCPNLLWRLLPAFVWAPPQLRKTNKQPNCGKLFEIIKTFQCKSWMGELSCGVRKIMCNIDWKSVIVLSVTKAPRTHFLLYLIADVKKPQKTNLRLMLPLFLCSTRNHNGLMWSATCLIRFFKASLLSIQAILSGFFFLSVLKNLLRSFCLPVSTSVPLCQNIFHILFVFANQKIILKWRKKLMRSFLLFIFPNWPFT